MKTYQVSYLLAISNLPERFFADVNGLKGHDAIYKNPGISIRSFVVANCLRHEIAKIPDEMIENVNECYEFSSNAEILGKIKGLLTDRANEILTMISEVSRESQNKVARFIRPLTELISLSKMSFDTFILSQDPSKNHADIFTQQGVQLKVALFELQDSVNDAIEVLNSLPTPKKLA